jgi:meiotically up-regulated gene 157 (Mug157) protein
MLDYAFGIQGKNIGVHSRFLNGTVLEPGFELDELCAPVIALSNYVRNTGDQSLLKEPHVKKSIREVEKTLQSKKHPSLWLYETLSGPDDDFEPLPYLTYSNALVYRLQLALAELKPRMNRDKDVAGHKELAEKVRSAVWKNLTAEGPKGKMFVWSSDLRGKHRFYTSPPGCLQLLPYFGFCEPEEQVWRNTVAFLHSREFPYSFAGEPFAEIGCAHSPQPWTLGLCNRMLSGQREKVRPLLEKCDFDGGIACEAFDSKTGKPYSGLAFATAAGFLAWAIWKAFGKGEGPAPAPAAKPRQEPERAPIQASLPVPAPQPVAPAPTVAQQQKPKPKSKTKKKK